MKGKVYSIATMMLAVPVLFTSVSFSVSAQSTEAEHVFTYEELACMDYEPIEDNTSRTGDQLVPINKTENSTKKSTVYYIIECADGYMLTSPTSSTFSRTCYSAGNSDSHVHQKWSFGKDEAGNLKVYLY